MKHKTKNRNNSEIIIWAQNKQRKQQQKQKQNRKQQHHLPLLLLLILLHGKGHVVGVISVLPMGNACKIKLLKTSKCSGLLTLFPLQHGRATLCA